MSEDDSAVLDVISIGDGFAGMYAVHRLRAENLTLLAFDEAADVGGVWYWNRYLRKSHVKAIEAHEAAEAEWGLEVAAAANKTVIPLANSWWIGANVPGKPRVFLPYLGGFPAYQKKCREIAESEYPGFSLAR